MRAEGTLRDGRHRVSSNCNPTRITFDDLRRNDLFCGHEDVIRGSDRGFGNAHVAPEMRVARGTGPLGVYDGPVRFDSRNERESVVTEGIGPLAEQVAALENIAPEQRLRR